MLESVEVKPLIHRLSPIWNAQSQYNQLRLRETSSLEEGSRVQISHAGQKPADVNPTIADGGANGWKDGVVKII